MLAYVSQAYESGEEQHKHKQVIKGEFFVLKKPSQLFKKLQNLKSLPNTGAMHELRAVPDSPWETMTWELLLSGSRGINLN